jgi:hypothetical protein
MKFAGLAADRMLIGRLEMVEFNISPTPAAANRANNAFSPESVMFSR